MSENRDIIQVLAIYQQRLAKFKREMEDLGVKVEVSASLGVYTSKVELDEEPEEKEAEDYVMLEKEEEKPSD